VRLFLITLAVSTVAAVVLWQLGLAFAIWPTHPFLATVITAAGCGIMIQLLGSHLPKKRDKTP